MTVAELSRRANEARTKKVPPERRREIARQAAKARWAKVRAAAKTKAGKTGKRPTP